MRSFHTHNRKMDNDEYLCPICYELLFQPVRSECGHTFCCHCLQRWFSMADGTLTCPLDRKHLCKIPQRVEEELEAEIMQKRPEHYELRRAAVAEIQSQLLHSEIRMVASRSCSNSELVTNLKNLDEHSLRDADLELAMLQLPRGEFVPPQHRAQAYVTHHPLQVSLLQFNVSAAHLHVFCLQELGLKQGEAFLDIGTGCGVVAAFASQLVKKQGTVHAIDIRDTVTAFAKRNIAVQNRRVHAARKEREEHMAPTPMGKLLPGTVFAGSHDGHQFYLFIDSRDTLLSFRGRFHWPNRGKTTTLCKGSLHAADDTAAYVDISLQENQVLSTRYMWDQLTWVPLTYTLRWDGTTLSCGNFSALKVSDQPLPHPDLSSISVFTSNAFSVPDTDRLLAALPEEHKAGYDKIHSGASCPEQRLGDIVRLLKIGGVLVTPVESDLCLVKKDSESTFSIVKKLRVRYGQLLSVEEQQELVSKERTQIEERERRVQAAREEVYYSKCCGLPVAQKFNAVDTASIGGCLDLDDGSGVLLAKLTENIVHADPSLTYCSALCLGADVLDVQCKKCRRALGVTFVTEPPERQAGESWVGKYLLCNAYLRTDPAPPLEDEQVLKCANEACGNVLCRRDQILSTRHRWKLEGSMRSEAATYINAVEEGSCRTGPVTVQFLAQGRMKVAPLYCKQCDSEVGWQFVSHVCGPQRQKLAYYEGRHGLVMSKVSGMPSTEASMTRLLLQTILNRSQANVFLAEDEDE